MQFLAADGLLFVAAMLLLRAIFVCRASHHLLALAWMVPAPATLRLQRLKPWCHQSMKPRRHQSLKPRCRPLMKWLSSPSLYPRCWSDFCKEYTLMPHALEYNYTLPSPTPVDPTQVVADSGMPSGVLNP